jgi:hypothetical protein
MLDFFDFMIIKKTQESSKDPANGGCGNKNLAGMAFVNCARVHRVIFRERVMRVCGGGRRGGGSCEGFVGKRHSIINYTVKNGLVKIARSQNPKTSVKGFIDFLGIAVTSSLFKGGTGLISLALLEEADPKESSLAG